MGLSQIFQLGNKQTSFLPARASGHSSNQSLTEQLEQYAVQEYTKWKLQRKNFSQKILECNFLLLKN